ncbi:MAG: efflux RND transporter periplasmic adaptor subunit [Chloroflexi bacterium]|nr:efflux RND transporter periplasmic adaptor subunit [Chloroflexota bacterium]MCL5275339.1 efflux RND transporter periplasmic adaptor subunit [Chloroflexota bacterium]
MRRTITVTLALVLLSLSAGCANTPSGPLKATGTVESTDIIISPEVGGRVVEVNVREGDHVKAGQALVRLDATLLQSQLSQAQATLKAAQANYDLLAAGPTPEQLRQAEAAVVMARDSYTRTVEGVRQADVDAAQAAYNAAVQGYNKVKAGPQREDYAQAEANYRNAAAALRRAQADYDRANAFNPAAIGASPAALALEQATNNFDAAKSIYDKLAQTPDAAQISAAYQQVQAAKAVLDRTMEPARSFDIEQAAAAVEAALAQLDGLKAGARAQQLDAAKAQIAAAQAAVHTLQVQIDKMVLLAPADGVLLTRSIEPGEMALPGAPLLTLSQLAGLTLTVYVPEESYGAIKLNQAATVTADSFPNTTFAAKVTHIADKAEFTPRNVQTTDGRRTTVFAVRLDVSDPSGQLKPGMPADVVFGG